MVNSKGSRSLRPQRHRGVGIVVNRNSYEK